ncbi:hypothetical protein [Methylobacterium persicinum]|uniref:Uncharacterized protein n=1 Tax=Methylobacterium persicinum TaxID=374426 RepID=A0ABU0HGH3_9HYPH|nr:hypothetical protein [Methylobacterium persicinum]MDQ0441410.1 hypothetical protein [Methylobacterium persicinum]GJE39175.1 hypothetical protein KHHGKMAE_3254 [Methylobacterium persicinum]
MGDPPASSETGPDRANVPPRGKQHDPSPTDGSGRGGGSAEEQARLDRDAGDVADDLADFA